MKQYFFMNWRVLQWLITFYFIDITLFYWSSITRNLTWIKKIRKLIILPSYILISVVHILIFLLFLNNSALLMLIKSRLILFQFSCFCISWSVINFIIHNSFYTFRVIPWCIRNKELWLNVLRLWCISLRNIRFILEDLTIWEFHNFFLLCSWII